MKRTLFYVLFLISSFWIMGCTDMALQEGNVIDEQTKPHAENLAEVEKIMLTWSAAYEQTNFEEVIFNEITRWQKTHEAIPFVVTDPQLMGNEHIGLFRSSQNWEIKGRSKTGPSFILENNEGTVTLTHTEHQETYVQEEFDFLLPIQHVQVVENILKESNYEYLSWSKLPGGWLVELRASIQPIEDVFSHYLEEHFLQVEEKMEYQLHGFSILYRLQLREINENMVLKRIHFSLLKNEELLDILEFRL